MKLYVGNLSFEVTENELREMFEPFGAATATIVTDRDTGRARGFGFVEIPDASQGNKAIAEMNGKNMNGRDLTVNEARPREARSGGFSGNRGGGRGR